MASQPVPPGIPGTFRFEFDPVNKILLVRFEGRVTDELLREEHSTARKHWAATGARAGTADFSSITELAVSGEVVRQLAQQPPMPDGIRNPLVILMPTTAGYGVARMYQIVGDRGQPLVQVVRTMHETLAALGVESSHFESLE